MVQRGIIDLGQGIFRISAPNIDVKHASREQLMIDERVLYPQILQSIFIPFVSPNANVTVPIIDYGFIPVVYAYSQDGDINSRAYPSRAIWSPNSSSILNNFFAYSVTSNSLTVSFMLPTILRGAQFLTMRP